MISVFSYGSIVWLVLIYLWIRLWILYGPRIPLMSLALIVLAFFGIPKLRLPAVVFPLFAIAVAITLILIDKYKSALRLGR